MPPPLIPDLPLAGADPPPIASPDPTEPPVAIFFDADSGAARVVFYFERGQTEFLPGLEGHQSGIDFLAGILSTPATEAEMYASADTTAIDRSHAEQVNRRVAGLRMLSLLVEMDGDEGVLTRMKTSNFGQAFCQEVDGADAGPDDNDTMRVVVVYAFPDVLRQFSMWLSDPVRKFGLEHPEFLE